MEKPKSIEDNLGREGKKREEDIFKIRKEKDERCGRLGRGQKSVGSVEFQIPAALLNGSVHWTRQGL